MKQTARLRRNRHTTVNAPNSSLRTPSSSSLTILPLIRPVALLQVLASCASWVPSHRLHFAQRHMTPRVKGTTAVEGTNKLGSYSVVSKLCWTPFVPQGDQSRRTAIWKVTRAWIEHKENLGGIQGSFFICKGIFNSEWYFQAVYTLHCQNHKGILLDVKDVIHFYCAL